MCDRPWEKSNLFSEASVILVYEYVERVLMHNSNIRRFTARPPLLYREQQRYHIYEYRTTVFPKVVSNNYGMISSVNHITNIPTAANVVLATEQSLPRIIWLPYKPRYQFLLLRFSATVPRASKKQNAII